MDDLCIRASQITSVAKDSVAVYFRLEENKYGGKAGVFLTGNSKNGFISVSPTDLHLYSPTDIEHVCWYYAPIWAGKAVWIDPYANKNINMHLLSYVRPLYKNGVLLGVVGIDINLATIKNISDSINLNEFSVLLLGSEKNIVYNTDSKYFIHLKQENNEIRNLRNILNSENKNTFETFSKNGKTYFGTSRTLQNAMTLILSIPDTEMKKSRNIFLLRNITIMILALLTAWAIIKYVFKKILNPISDLTKSTYRLSRGELGIPVLYKSNNEIGLLADSIRKMALQLKEYIEFIREQTISEREAKEAAILSSKAKSDFLASMSHEIRTPINAVLGMDEMIIRESKDKTILQYAVNIKQAGNSLLSIINDVLDFSKIESGKMELFPVEYDLSSMLVDVITIISERAKHKNLQFKLNINKKIPKYLTGDNLRIKQCILNLLTNAVKYTPKGQIFLTVDYSQINDNSINLYFNVKDTGIGIKEEDLDKLFNAFERIEENRNRTIEGTGLGLNIVEKLLTLMNSRLNVKSEYSRGSEFSFTIEQKLSDKNKNEILGDIMGEYNKSLSSIKKYKEMLFAPDARILIVDDTEMNLEVLKGLLKNTKIKIDTATSGKEALEKSKLYRYDILFIDHRMPEMDGIETLKAMKESKFCLNTSKPFIALTANAISGAKEMYLKAGFTDYLSKPVSPEKLENMIKKYLPKTLLLSHNGKAKKSSDRKKSKLKRINGINLKEGILNCGSEKLLIKMIKMFHSSIESTSAELEKFLQEENINNFRVKVHSLKSSSRLIGAVNLSKKAKEIEELAAENNIREINKKFPIMQKLYKSYVEKLEKTVIINTEENNKKSESILSEDEFIKKLESLKSAAEDLDSNKLDLWAEEISKYSIPEKYINFCEEIKKKILYVDFTGINESLKFILP